ncbi:hypothetical protein [Pseudomonas syringae]|nr:hypothetical protein [Pseudomonas syringae]EGH70665.1 hypothetical protein PSYAR_08916 [Pseudomonas syringae pv. aceris str. M302273]
MQAQHIIILTGMIVGFQLLTVFVERAIKRALCRSFRTGQPAGVTLKNISSMNLDLSVISCLPHTRNEVEALIKQLRQDFFFQRIRGATV